MELQRIVYISRPFGFDLAALRGILLTARKNNARDDITGSLICRADMYLQLLEGPCAAVDAVYARILEDDRHLEVTRLMTEPCHARLFPQWAMRDDPARSWMWTPDEIADGAPARADRDELLAVFERAALG